MDNIKDFYEEYKSLFENDFTNYEFWIEVGQLTIKYDLQKYDVLEILTQYDTSFDYGGFLQSTYDDWDKYKETEPYYTWYRTDDEEYSIVRYKNLEDIGEEEKEEARQNNWKLLKVEEINF